MRSLRRRLRKIDPTDLMFFGGIAALAFGLAWVWRPLGPISVGLFLIALAWQLGKPLPERPTRRLIATLSTEDGGTDEELIG